MNGFIQKSYITIGIRLDLNSSKEEWEGAYEVIVKRNKKYALLWRNSSFKPLAFACEKVISGEDFLVSTIPLTEGTKVLAEVDGKLLYPLENNFDKSC